MTHLLVFTITASFATGQAADTASPAAIEAVGRPAPSTMQGRRAIIEQALADFDAAVASRDQGSLEGQRLYRKALAGFESLLQAGVHSSGLHYNLANTYLRLGEVGKAIVHYRRARRLAPGDERIEKNLESARRLCRVQIPNRASSAFMDTLFFWHFGTSLTARTSVALIGYALFWLLMLIRLFALRGVPSFAWTIRLVAAVVFVVGASVAWENVARHHQLEGVIVADEVVLRKGNGEYYEPQFEQALSAGVEFRLLESRQDVEGAAWYHVELRDGKNGWLRADHADVI